MSKNSFTKPHQFKILVDFFQQHSDLAKGHLKTATAKTSANNLWKKLTTDLNAAGPPLRDVVGWKKVWADYKNHLRSKLRKNKTSLSGTGGGPSRYCPLSALEEQVVELLSMNESTEGMDVASFGAEQRSSSQFHSDSDRIVPDTYEIVEAGHVGATINSPTPENLIPQRSPSQRSRSIPSTRSKENLLRTQVENQNKFHQNSIKVLKDIRDNISKNSKRDLEFKNKQFKFSMEKFEFKKKISQEKIKLKALKLEIKRQMLDMQLKQDQ